MVVMAMDEGLARMRAHHNNIDRYRTLLATELSDLERQFIERRLAEEQQAAEELVARREIAAMENTLKLLGGVTVG
jgi:hypothetical protein